MVTLEQLRFRHPEHVAEATHWETLSAVVQGGKAMSASMKRKLLPNPDGRPNEIMDERVRLASYSNRIGPILTRFNSQLFAKNCVYTGSTDPYWESEFFPKGALLDGDDDARASFKSLLTNSMFQALATGKAIAQVDTRMSNGAVSRLAQSQTGELKPYVILHPRNVLWDWDADNDGFRFVKLHQFKMKRDRWDQVPIPEHDFTIFQRENDGRILVSRYTVRKRLKSSQEKMPTGQLNLDTLKEDEVDITTVLENRETFNYQGRFQMPILSLTLPEPLWIGDQLYDSQKSYFGQTAAVEWALYTTNYSMPVINGVDDVDDDPIGNRKFGDGYYLTLKTGQSIQWTERPGAAFQISINYRNEIKKEIYDTLQQIALSAADGSAIIARSGESKKEDRRPEQLLLSKYGQLTREFAKQILDVASIARGENVDWEVDGMKDFLGAGLLEDIADYSGIQLANIPSETFKKETAKHFVTSVGKTMDIDGAKVKQSLSELDKAKIEDFAPPAPPAPQG